MVAMIVLKMMVLHCIRGGTRTFQNGWEKQTIWLVILLPTDIATARTRSPLPIFGCRYVRGWMDSSSCFFYEDDYDDHGDDNDATGSAMLLSPVIIRNCKQR